MKKARSKAGRSHRSTIVVELPTGWGRAGAAGLLAAFFGWVVPVAIAVFGFWVLADDPWLRQQSWQDAVDAGASFWALSLGSPALLGQVEVALIPSLWTVAQLFALRVFLSRMDRFSPGSVWAAIPGFLLVALPLAFSAGRGVTWWKVLIGATIVSLLATLWVYVLKSGRVPNWARKLRVAGAGIAVGIAYTTALLLVGTIAVAVSAWQRRAGLAEAAAALHATGTEGFTLWLLQIAYLPLGAAWATSWLLGTGFRGVGGAIVSPSSPPTQELGIPAWQLIPTGVSSAPWWIFTVLGVTVGALAWLLLRRRPIGSALTLSGSSAIVGISVFAVWMLLGGGSLGDGALIQLGPPVGDATLRVTLTFFLPAAALPILLHPRTTSQVKSVVSSMGQAGAPAEKETVDVPGGGAEENVPSEVVGEAPHPAGEGEAKTHEEE